MSHINHLKPKPKLKTCPKCHGKDVRYLEQEIAAVRNKPPSTMLYVGCASCGYNITHKIVGSEDYAVNFGRAFIKQEWNHDRNYNDKRIKRR